MLSSLVWKHVMCLTLYVWNIKTLSETDLLGILTKINVLSETSEKGRWNFLFWIHSKEISDVVDRASNLWLYPPYFCDGNLLTKNWKKDKSHHILFPSLSKWPLGDQIKHQNEKVRYSIRTPMILLIKCQADRLPSGSYTLF